MLPMEFRIWDNQEKRWRQRREHLGGFIYAINIGIDGGVYELRKRKDKHILWQNIAHDAGRYEVSQYTTITTIQQQKIFGGDIITCSDFEGKTLPVEQYHGCWQVVSDDIVYGYLYALHDVAIIGNKWEGIGKQESANLSGSSGDSTGQQQAANSLKIEQEDLSYWRTNIRDKVFSFLDEKGKEFATETISGVKPKWKHDILRAQELVEGILKCKRMNKPPDIELVTELNELLQYKIDTTQA